MLSLALPAKILPGEEDGEDAVGVGAKSSVFPASAFTPHAPLAFAFTLTSRAPLSFTFRLPAFLASTLFAPTHTASSPSSSPGRIFAGRARLSKANLIHANAKGTGSVDARRLGGVMVKTKTGGWGGKDGGFFGRLWRPTIPQETSRRVLFIYHWSSCLLAIPDLPVSLKTAPHASWELVSGAR